MNDCVNVEVRDALPDLLNGRLGQLDTATMNAHVEACPECRAELALLREARATARVTPSLDIVRMASAIPPYGGLAAAVSVSRQPPRDSSRIWKFAAAALLVATGGWIASMQRDNSRADLPRTAAVAPPVSDTASEPSSSPASIAGAPEKVPTAGQPSRELQVASLSLVGSTADISDSDLEQLVQDLDAIDAIPAAEPAPVTISVEDLSETNDQ